MIVPVLVWVAVAIGCFALVFVAIYTVSTLFDVSLRRGRAGHDAFWCALGVTTSIAVLGTAAVGVVVLIALGAAVA